MIKYKEGEKCYIAIVSSYELHIHLKHLPIKDKDIVGYLYHKNFLSQCFRITNNNVIILFLSDFMNFNVCYDLGVIKVKFKVIIDIKDIIANVYYSYEDNHNQIFIE